MTEQALNVLKYAAQQAQACPAINSVEVREVMDPKQSTQLTIVLMLEKLSPRGQTRTAVRQMWPVWELARMPEHFVEMSVREVFESLDSAVVVEHPPTR